MKVSTGGWKDQRLSLFNDRRFVYRDSEEPRRTLWLSEGSDDLYFRRQSRDQHRIDVMVADASTGEVRALIQERLNTYVECQPIELLASGDMLWWSERYGWAHLYRFGPDGSLRNRLTEGPFSVRRIAGVDEDRGIVYFMANAREAGEDPYYQHLYRVNLDGTGMQLLNPGEFDHRTSMGESNRFFVDNFARVNSVPASALLDISGRKIIDLEVADFGALMAAGYRFPEPYTVKADDGITDLYGNIYRPFDFDPDKSYPIIAFVYPGPQTESVITPTGRRSTTVLPRLWTTRSRSRSNTTSTETRTWRPISRATCSSPPPTKTTTFTRPAPCAWPRRSSKRTSGSTSSYFRASDTAMEA